MQQVAAPQDRSSVGPAQETRAMVIVNRRAGRVLQMGREAFEQQMKAHFARHGFEAEVAFVHARDVGAKLKAALASSASLVILSGGDGTISHALPTLIRAHRPVAILPLGTLNLLGRDLGLSGELGADIRRLAEGRERPVSLATVNGRLFHSIAGFGLLSVMARERENARRALPFSRALSFMMAAAKSLFTYRPMDVEVVQGNQTRTFPADTVLVTSNRFEGVPWYRPALDTATLEVHLLEAGGLKARLHLLWLVARGRWRDHPALTSFICTRFVVRRRRKNSLALAIDGERCRMHGPAVFEVSPERLFLHA